MARIVETLRRGDTLRIPIAEGIRPYRPDVGTLRGPEPEEEIPFIEVGGKNTPIEASASVRATEPKAKATASSQVLPSKAPAELQHREDAPAPVTAVSFHPLPVPATPPRPVEERFARDLVAFHHPDHPTSSQYRSLAEALTSQLAAHQPQVLLFAPTKSWIDTASVVLNLGIAASARPDFRVVVIDADVRKHAIAARLGISPAPGLLDVLSGKTALTRAVQDTGHNALFALSAGKIPDGAANPIAGEAMRAVLRHLRTRFEWVLIAAPCWDGRPDVVALGAACDAVYLLLPENEADSPATKDLADLIVEQGSRLRGCIHLRAG
jgi:Mrp family chromosome partitioning ATPase